MTSIYYAAYDVRTPTGLGSGTASRYRSGAAPEEPAGEAASPPR